MHLCTSIFLLIFRKQGVSILHAGFGVHPFLFHSMVYAGGSAIDKKSDENRPESAAVKYKMENQRAACRENKKDAPEHHGVRL